LAAPPPPADTLLRCTQPSRLRAMSDKRAQGAKGARVLLLTTAHNEAHFADALFDGVMSQTRRPDRWIVVDDGSSDGTFEALARRAARADWITLLRREPVDDRIPDRLAVAAVPRSLNQVLAGIDWRAYTHIGKLDADVQLPAGFLEQLLRDFEADPSLGVSGGLLTERHGRRWRDVTQPPTHAPPPARLYSLECFEASGGFRERLAWDTIDEVYSRMLGYSTCVNADVRVRHLRVQGTADGRLRGRARHGECAWIAHYPPLFVLLRSTKVAVRFTPWGLSGLAFLWGYLAAALRGVPRVDDVEFRCYVRRELRARITTSLRAAITVGGQA
jgi:poly-beta-1,6-N-acetyl-D-glucosamine synthase